MRRSNFPLRLPSSLLEEARKTAEMEGVVLNQLVSIAVAEKIATLRTDDFFRERARRANVEEALQLLDKSGSEEPQVGDEMPEMESVAASLDRLLRRAIKTRHLIKFLYKNQERVAEPHDYGRQNGIVRLFCYQVGGRSSGRLPGWRLINVAAMQDCKILEKEFRGKREIPTGVHHHWIEIFASVGPASE